MKLSDYKGIEGIEKLGDIVEPAWNIFDAMNEARSQEGFTVAKMFSYILKNNAKDFAEILSALDDMTFEEFNEQVDLPKIFKMIMEKINDEAFMSFFGNQGLNKDDGSFGSVSESSKAGK